MGEFIQGNMMMQKAQSTMDYLILTSVILVVIVPLLFISTREIDVNRLKELGDALGELKTGIFQVGNLGYGTMTRVIVRVPKGVVEQSVGEISEGVRIKGKKGQLYYKLGGNDVSVDVPLDVEGILPLNEGLHYIQLFNNGSAVLLYECGNNKREAFEQCDGKDNLGCAVRDQNGNIIKQNFCTPPNYAGGGCKCACDSNGDCQQTTGYCDTTTKICVPCSTDRDCRTGDVCLDGRCITPKKCTDSRRDCTYGPQVCNKKIGECQPCEGTDPDRKCEPGDVCDAFRYCRAPGINNEPPKVSAGPDQQITLPQNQVNLDGDVTDDGLPNPPGKVTTLWRKESGPGTVTFGNANAIDTTATFSTMGGYVLRLEADDSALKSFDEMSVTVLSGGLIVCGDGKIGEPAENCEFDPVTGEPIKDKYGKHCDDNPILRCHPKTCLCVPAGQSYCGDGQISSNEECDVGTGNWGVQGTCSSGKVCTAGCVCQPDRDFCGDGKISSFPGREQCDFMMSGNGGCPATKYCTRWCSCRPRYGLGWCGDGKLQAGFEECEPGAVGCPPKPNQISLGCRADCRCDYGDTTPPDRPDPEGQPRQKCQVTAFCIGFSCVGDCPPDESCAGSGSTCGCVKDAAQPRPCSKPGGGTACNPDWSCPRGYQCDKTTNCCEPLTGEPD